MIRTRALCWLVLLGGCSDRIQTGEDWPDAGAPRPDGNTGAAGQSGASGTGGTTAGGSAGTTGATAGTGGVGTSGGAGGTGGTGGAAGKGGSGGGSAGSSGGFDGGGDGCVPDPSFKPACPASAWIPSAACGAALCGNGGLDSCTNGCGQSVSEMCDGSMPGGRTCQDLGYAGGTLKCSAHCGWDTSGCTRCAATDDVVRACINAPVDASVPSAIAMDATEQEIALAWTSPDTAGSLRLHFARFAPDLTLISESGPFGPPCVGKIALAARPGGWSLAAETAADLQLLALDATGAMTSVIPVASLWPSRVSTKMVLAHRDGSGPLLAWEDGFAGVDLPPLRGWGHMNLVSADGASTMGASPAGLPLSLELIAPTVGDLAAIPTPVGWLVASDHQSADEPDLTETEIVELSYEANLVKHFAPSTGSSGQPRLAAEDRTFRISRVFQASADGTANHVAPLTYDGLGGFPVALGAPGYINPAPMVLINGATSVFTAVGTGNSPRALHYLQYDALLQPAGILQPVGMPRVIATDIDAIKTYVAARRGPDAVVAWINGAPPAAGTPGIGPSSIGLARVTPQ